MSMTSGQLRMAALENTFADSESPPLRTPRPVPPESRHDISEDFMFSGDAVIEVPLDVFYEDRIEEVKRARKYFKGKPDFPRLDKEDPNREKPRVAVGMPAIVINRHASALFGRRKFPGYRAFNFVDDEFGEALENSWKRSKMAHGLISAAREDLITGDSIIKLVYKESGRTPWVKFSKQRKENSWVIAVDGDPSSEVGWVFQWMRKNQTFYREEIDRWSTFVYEGVIKLRSEQTPSGETFEYQYIEYHLFDEIQHNLGFVPVCHIKSFPIEEDAWGQSVYYDLYPAFDILNEAYSNVAFAVFNQADPLLWLSGARKGDELYRDADGIWYFENPEAKVNVLQWEGTPEQVYKYLSLLEDAILKKAQLPVPSQAADVRYLSASALEILYQDYVDVSEERRGIWEEGLNDMFWKTGLILNYKGADFDDTDWSRMDIAWGELLPRAYDQILADDIRSQESGIISQAELQRRHIDVRDLEKIRDEIQEELAAEDMRNRLGIGDITGFEPVPMQRTVESRKVDYDKGGSATSKDSLIIGYQPEGAEPGEAQPPKGGGTNVPAKAQ